jgi:hypothetical protein
VARLLAHWRVDPDLTAIRDAADLDEGCRRLWADVEALRRRAEVANK